MSKQPTVFISYSHDSDEHADRVLALADSLCEHGIEVFLDRYVFPAPKEGWPLWMERSVGADFVLMICTESYVRRVRNEETQGKGLGVRWEGKLIYSLIYDSQSPGTKFIPILFSDSSPEHIPAPARGHSRYVLTAFDLGEPQYEALCRHLTNQPATPRPDLPPVKPLSPVPRHQPSSGALPHLEGSNKNVSPGRAANWPSLQGWHLRDRPILAAVGTLLGDPHHPVRILLGPSGSGKTMLAAEFAEYCQTMSNNPGKICWIDCRNYEKWEDLEPAIKRADFVFLDNLTKNHPYIHQKHKLKFEKALRGKRLVAITLDDRVAEELQGIMGCADCSDTIVHVTGFSTAEAQEFLKKTKAKCSENLGTRFRGSPFFYRLWSHIRSSGEGGWEQTLNDLNEDKLLGAILNRLIDRRGLPDEERILRLLSRVPYLGMESRMIGNILSLPSEEVASHIDQLQEYGVVYRIPDILGNCDGLFVCHDLVRLAMPFENEEHSDPDNKKSKEEKEWRRQYLKLLQERNACNGSFSPVTLVDAWITSWWNVFEENRSTEEWEHKIQSHRFLLKSILPQAETETISSALSSLPSFLSSRMRDPAKERCDVLIALADIIAEMCVPEYGSRILANTIWVGSINPNAWARASSIVAAVEHWGESGDSVKLDGKVELKRWIDYRFEKLFSGEEAFSASHMVLDLLAWTGGMLRLKCKLTDLCDELSSRRFLQAFPYLTLAELVLVVHAADNGWFGHHSESAPAKLVRGLVRDRWNESLTDPLVAYTRGHVTQYILRHCAAKLHVLGMKEWPEPPISDYSYAGDVASQARSGQMFDFVMEIEKRVFHLPVVVKRRPR